MQSKVYFLKELVSNPFLGPEGKQVQFEVLGQDFGVIALQPGTDDLLIASLREANKRRIGGIVEISLTEYEQKKKEFPYKPFGTQLEPLRVFGDPFKAPPQLPTADLAVGDNNAYQQPPSPPNPHDSNTGPVGPAFFKVRSGKPPAKSPAPVAST